MRRVPRLGTKIGKKKTFKVAHQTGELDGGAAGRLEGFGSAHEDGWPALATRRRRRRRRGRRRRRRHRQRGEGLDAALLVDRAAGVDAGVAHLVHRNRNESESNSRRRKLGQIDSNENQV